MKKKKTVQMALGYIWRCYAAAKAVLPDVSEDDLKIMRSVRGYTMTSWERLYGVINSIRYLVKTEIPGDIVECGVWKGGSMMAAAKTLMMMNQPQRELFLFDTF